MAQLKSDLATAGGIASESAGANGYIKFKSGVILQWGYTKYQEYYPGTGTYYGMYVAVFPIAFPAAVFSVAIAAPGALWYTGISNLDRIGFVSVCGNPVSSDDDYTDSRPCYYIAIGR